MCVCLPPVKVLRFHAHTHFIPFLPAVDCSSCICLLRAAAEVSPGPLVAVPGQTQAAVHCETVVDLFT